MPVHDDTVLLTPGPLTTSSTVRRAMLKDWGSRDPAFIAMNARVRERVVAIAEGGADYVGVPVQGSGTFAVEATVGTLLPRNGKLLVVVNGAYGKRIVRMAQIMGRAVVAIETAEDTPSSPEAVDAALAADPAITHVAAVHCETTSGILNPIEAIADVVAARGRALIVDAMSSFGAIPCSAPRLRCDAIVASSNKCLEGAPGFGFAVVRRAALEAAKGNAHALSLDLHDQWQGFEKNGQWRFTPPTHVVAALDQALAEHAAEGGVAGRGTRYRRNAKILTEGMRALGFETLLPDHLQAPIIVTFHMPSDPRFRFEDFYDRLNAKGYVIYPGKLTVADSFRIGCIGRIGESEMLGALAAIAKTLKAMGVTTGARAAA